jgi:uncharacterized protein (TIGR00297 family)
VFGFGGLTWAAVLIAFFAASVLLSRVGSVHKARVLADFAKSGPRDFVQTLANGGVAALMALGVGIFGHHSPLYPYLTLAYFGSLAAATADTWATELGMLSKQQPRRISTWQPTQPGVSGGVTLVGMLASVAGGAFMGVVTFGLIQAASLLSSRHWFLQDWFLLPTLTLAGLVGSVADSFLGATLQRLYYCERCQVPTEKPTHVCGASARLIRGRSWMNNDLVNFLATCIGAIVALITSLPFLIS